MGVQWGFDGGTMGVFRASFRPLWRTGARLPISTADHANHPPRIAV
jgi:hypothetical protein